MRTYWKPWVVRRGSKTSPGHAGRDDLVDLAGRQRLGQERHGGPQVLGGQVAVGVEPLAVGQA